jgi:flagellar hook protein FlgE
VSILSAMNSALSGLNAQATDLNNISNNVANASTVGYKEADTDFDSIVLSGVGSASPNLAGVTASTKMDISTAGQLQTTGVGTDLAISGNGFMVVNTQANSANGSYLLTQAGSFRPDAQGNLVNAAGYYLQGQPLNADGTPVGSAASSIASLSTVNVANLSVAATPTSTMTFNANLPSADTGPTATATSSLSSSETYYDGLGTPQTLTFTFTPSATANQWTMNITDSATGGASIGTATLNFNGTGTSDAGTLAGVDTVGTTTPSPNYNSTTGTFNVTTGGGQSLPISIGALGSSDGMSQLDGAYQTTNVAQNGSAFGLLQGVSVGTNGVVTASFSNGATRPIYQVDLATVPNQDGLTPVAGDAYALNPSSGVPQLYQPGTGPAGTLDAGSLEGSNVDITTQLTNMIETQRAYSSNAMVVQTANQMMQTVDTLNQP